MDPLLRDIPTSFTSERLLIRCPLPGDGAAVNAAVAESRDRLRPWMPWAREPETVEQTEIHRRRAYLHFLERSDLPLHLYLRSSGEFVGGSGLHRIKWDVPKFEIGYWVRTKFEGQGLITEAVNAIADFALTELKANRVEIRCDPRNTRSAAVAERCGFTLEARLRNDAVDTEGRLRDTLIYARFPEFETQHTSG